MTTRRRSVARPAASRFGRYALAAATSASGAAALAAPSTARADFSGPYTLNPPVNGSYATAGIYGSWTAVFTGTAASRTINTTSAPVSLSLSDAGNNSSNQLDFNTTIAGAGSLSFNYNYTLGSGFAQYVLNGTATFFPNTSGTIDIPSVAAGNTFGFRLGIAYSGSPTSLTISNFAAPVPEPTVNALIVAGAVGLLGLRETRRRRRVRLAAAV